MKRFFQYWQNYGIAFDADLTQQLALHTRLYTAKREEMVEGPLQARRRYYFVLSGCLVCEKYTLTGGMLTQRFVLPQESFTSTVHLYTPRPAHLSFTALKATDLLVIDNSKLQQLEQKYQAVSDILHILKQRYITQLDLHVQLLQQPDGYARFCFLQDNMPELCAQVSNAYLQRFLGISNGTFYTYQRRYLLEKLRKK